MNRWLCFGGVGGTDAVRLREVRLWTYRGGWRRVLRLVAVTLLVVGGCKPFVARTRDRVVVVPKANVDGVETRMPMLNATNLVSYGASSPGFGGVSVTTAVPGFGAACPPKLAVWIHGANVSGPTLLDGLDVARQRIDKLLGIDTVAVVWPSDPSPLLFLEIEDAAEHVGRAGVGWFLASLRRRCRGTSVLVFAHSLGVRVALVALRQQHVRVDGLVLMAPAMDSSESRHGGAFADAFRRVAGPVVVTYTPLDYQLGLMRPVVLGRGRFARPAGHVGFPGHHPNVFNLKIPWREHSFTDYPRHLDELLCWLGKTSRVYASTALGQCETSLPTAAARRWAHSALASP